MAEETTKGTGTEGQKETEGTQNQKTQQKSTETKQEETKVDIEKAKSDAVSELLKTLGVENADALKGIVSKHKEDEEANKTELQKKDDALTETTKQLVSEREGRIIAEAKLSAIQLGAKLELVDDLVIVAKSKVTKEKDINAVIAEIKDSTSGKVYFTSEEEEEEETGKGKTKAKTVTRARVTKPSEKSKNKEGKEDEETSKKDEHKGSMAERLLAGRNKRKSHYFK